MYRFEPVPLITQAVSKLLPVLKCSIDSQWARAHLVNRCVPVHLQVFSTIARYDV
jgi:hypothetical protein